MKNRLIPSIPSLYGYRIRYGDTLPLFKPIPGLKSPHFPGKLRTLWTLRLGQEVSWAIPCRTTRNSTVAKTKKIGRIG